MKFLLLVLKASVPSTELTSRMVQVSHCAFFRAWHLRNHQSRLRHLLQHLRHRHSRPRHLAHPHLLTPLLFLRLLQVLFQPLRRCMKHGEVRLGTKKPGTIGWTVVRLVMARKCVGETVFSVLSPHLHREGSQVTGCHLSRFYRLMTPVKSFDSSSTALR